MSSSSSPNRAKSPRPDYRNGSGALPTAPASTIAPRLAAHAASPSSQHLTVPRSPNLTAASTSTTTTASSVSVEPFDALDGAVVPEDFVSNTKTKAKKTTTHQKSSPSAPSSTTTTTTESEEEDNREYSLSDFRRVGYLGHGTFGDVTLVQYLRTGDHFALKAIEKDLLDIKRLSDTAYMERNVMQKLCTHPNIIRLHGTFQDKRHLYYLMDFHAGGTMGDFLRNCTHRGVFDLPTVRFWCAEIFLALLHMHNEGVIYRDLKPENVLFTRDGHAILADFGLSKDFGNYEKLVEEGAPSMKGSPFCMAPEVRHGHVKPYDHRADWWSFGVFIYFLLYGQFPFNGNTHDELQANIEHQSLSFPKKITISKNKQEVKHVEDLLRQLLQKDMAKRPSADAIAQHPFWGSDLNWEDIYEWRVPVPAIFGEPRRIPSAIQLPQRSAARERIPDARRRRMVPSGPRHYPGFTAQAKPQLLDDVMAKKQRSPEKVNNSTSADTVRHIPPSKNSAKRRHVDLPPVLDTSAPPPVVQKRGGGWFASLFVCPRREKSVEDVHSLHSTSPAQKSTSTDKDKPPSAADKEKSKKK